MRSTSPCIALLALATALAAGASAQDAEPEGFRFRVTGLLDLRLVAADEERSFLDAGLGKLRYGGEGDGTGRETLFRLAQASVVLRASVGEALSARVQLGVDSDYRKGSGLNGADVTEAFLAYAPRLSDTLGLGLRAGILIPPISLENDGRAWTATRTVTPSAINSWIGEEVRATGLELTLRAFLQKSDLAATVAVFGWNDPGGSLVAWRGWALQDRQTGFTDRLPFATEPAFRPNRDFPVQTPWVAPFRELDGRAGWYAGASWEVPEKLEVRLMRYDNGGDRLTVERGQYSWETRFYAAGVRVALANGLELLAQGVSGRTKMGPGPVVNVPFEALFGLATVVTGLHRFSLRYDVFRNEDRNPTAAGETFGEEGSAWTAAWLFGAFPRATLALEVVSVRSERPSRRELGLAPGVRETIGTLGLRLKL